MLWVNGFSMIAGNADWEQVCQSTEEKKIGQHGGCDTFGVLLHQVH